MGFGHEKPDVYRRPKAYEGDEATPCVRTIHNIPSESIPIPIPTPTPMGTRSRRIANNWLQAADKPGMSQNDEKCPSPRGRRVALATRCQCCAATGGYPRPKSTDVFRLRWRFRLRFRFRLRGTTIQCLFVGPPRRIASTHPRVCFARGRS
jgi:hypothetical protein